MTQIEILKILKSKDKWWTIKEIAEKLNISNGAVNVACKKLNKSGEIMLKKDRTWNGSCLNLYRIGWSK